MSDVKQVKFGSHFRKFELNILFTSGVCSLKYWTLIDKIVAQ